MKLATSSRFFPAALAFAALLVLPTMRPAIADDTVLFSTVVPPNVVIIVDNSGSMNHVVWHPAFDPTATPTCRYWDDDRQYNVSSDSSDGFPGGSGDTSFRNGSYNISGEDDGDDCVDESIEIFIDPLVQLDYNSTRWQGRYLNWLFSPESNAYRNDIHDTNNGTYSTCIGGGTYDLFRRSRITAAQQILRQVICEVNTNGSVRFGLAQFRDDSDPKGGYIIVPAEDYLDANGDPNVYSLNGTTQSHGAHLDEAIEDLAGESWTPLGETLFQVYTYFMSRTAGDRPSNGGLTFPEYVYRTTTDGPYSSSGAPTVPDSPVEHACQRNFVVIITDGEPTKDDFDYSTSSNLDVAFEDFGTLIGDYNDDSENETPTSGVDCTGGTDWECGRYLDDIAKFMQDNDFRPDMDPQNGFEQVIDTYTVGFTTGGSANALLQKTAQVGNGLFSTSNDAGALAEAIVEAISDIVQKSQSFTAATVPATRTAEGGQFYASQFLPSTDSGFWEGRLRSWHITAAGEIRDKNGNCALDDPGAPATCVTGPFLLTAEPFWDAGEVLASTAAGSRNLSTSRLSGPGLSGMISFDAGTITAADMNLDVSEIPDYTTPAFPAPADVDELTAVVVDNLRGCELGSSGAGCVERPWKLGDIFHSDPVIVGPPSSFLQDGDYSQFRQQFLTRKRVLVAGANDGFLHFFDTGTWQPGATPPAYDAGTGAEIAGFMPYSIRQVAKGITLDDGSRSIYGVDGSPAVADVWLYTSSTQNAPQDGTAWDEWRTVAIGGLRQGGNSYYAFDITNPAGSTCPAPATGFGYPCYLWEFPREDAVGGIADYMGETWSKPVITRIKVNPTVGTPGATTPGYDRWVAVFATGYHETSDPNNATTYDPEATKGRAIVMLDIKTGKVIAEKRFDPTGSSSSTDPSTFPYSPANPEQSMHYAMTAAPAVYDLDFDGYADVIFQTDLGGNVWKWVINGIGQDPVNGGGSVTQPNWPFRKVFAAPTYYEAGPPAKTHYKAMFYTPSATLRNGNLWMVIGSGDRMNLKDEGLPGTPNENNRLYTLVDSDPLDKASPAPTQVVTETDLIELPTYTGCIDTSSYKGYYFVGEEAEKFITETDIFSYVVLAASYIPTTSADPCVSTGLAKLYAYRIYCGEGSFVEPGSGGVPSVSVDLGSGMPTSPQITISTGGYSGSSTDPNPNKVIINNQDGNLVVPGSGDMDGDGTPDCPGPNCPCPNWPNDCPLPEGGGGIGQFYWREL